VTADERRWGPLAAVLAIVATLYAPTTRGFFCGYDDFHELARAAFEDTVTPADVLTRPHDDGTRYRPLNRAVTLAMWRSAGFAPFWYRARNVLAHLGKWRRRISSRSASSGRGRARSRRPFSSACTRSPIRR